MRLSELTKGRAGALALGAMLVWSAASAIAGPRYEVPNTIRIDEDSEGNIWVEATLGQVRNTDNNVDRLLCAQTRAETTNAQGVVVPATAITCIATTVDRTVVCSSNSAAVGDALALASNDSLIDLRITNGVCTSISVYQSASTIKKN